MPRRVSPREARDLMDADGYVYVDVRSVPEFDAGHPAGAVNVPINHMGPAGMTPNPDFLRVMEAAFPRDARLIVSCKAGGRSARAAALLEANGFTNVVDQTAGFEGKPDPQTGVPTPGWRPSGLPVSHQASEGETYSSLEKKAR